MEQINLDYSSQLDPGEIYLLEYWANYNDQW